MQLTDRMPWSKGPRVIRRHTRNYLLASTLAVSAAVVLLILREILGWKDHLWTNLLPGILGLMPLLVFLPYAYWRTKIITREFNASGGRLCTDCAYNLSAFAASGTCPECGHVFDSTSDAETWKLSGFQRQVSDADRSPTP